MTTATAQRHALEGSDELRSRLTSYGFSLAEQRDPDRMPEQLILSHLADGPCDIVVLAAQRWWMERLRRFDLAFHRLRATGQIEFSNGCWRVVSGEKAEPEAPKKPVQRSLF